VSVSAPGQGQVLRARVTAAQGWIVTEPGARPRLVSEPWITIEGPNIVAVGHGPSARPPDAQTDTQTLVYDLGQSLLLPGLVNAHSHAFQRAIRGATHRRGQGDPSSFWSWRDAMYRVANSLDPEGVYTQTRACFAEMLARGITCVGEFHYLHHQPSGEPYPDPNALSLAVVRAARSVGLRLCLLEVYYARAGAGAGPLPEQRRFCDRSVDAYLARFEALRASTKPELDPESNPESAPWLSFGVTPHSVRAVPADALRELARYANEHRLPIHAHVSEQPLENQQCLEEYGRTPLEVFADAGCLDRPGAFTAVHAIHVDDSDLERMRGHQICACPSTEADLGDGVIPARRWREHGATLALGSDSNAVIDLLQEGRLLEMHERLAQRARLCLTDTDGQVAPVLLDAATIGGAQALGQPLLGKLAVGSPFDALALDLDHWLLRGVAPEHTLDALLLAGSAEPISQVWVGGRRRI